MADNINIYESNMSTNGNSDNRRDFLIALAKKYYKASKRLNEEFTLEDAINKVLARFLNTDESFEEVERIMLETTARREKEKREDINPDNVRYNHNILSKKLKELFKLLNQNDVDYQLADNLGCFVQYGEESSFVHHNIIISINEEDLPKLKSVCNELGISYNDNRFNSKRTLKDGKPDNGFDVCAEGLDDDIKLNFRLFRRLENGAVAERNYYLDNNTQMVQDIAFPLETASIIYGGKKATFDGVPIFVQPSEYTYLQMHGSHNWADGKTMDFVASRVDRNVLSELCKATYNRISYNHPANTSLTDLHNMINSGGGNTNSKENPKVLSKMPNESLEAGFISNTIITTLALITFVLCFIGIALIYLIK